jgi:hypothetical protein
MVTIAALGLATMFAQRLDDYTRNQWAVKAADEKTRQLSDQLERQAEMRHNAMLLLRIKKHAAVRIQSTWRGYAVRLEPPVVQATLLEELYLQELLEQKRETQRFKNLAMLLMCALVVLSLMTFWMKHNMQNMRNQMQNKHSVYTTRH